MLRPGVEVLEQLGGIAPRAIVDAIATIRTARLTVTRLLSSTEVC